MRYLLYLTFKVSRKTPHTNILNMAGTAVIDDNSSDSDDEITRILENKDSKNTKRCTTNAILAFHASLKDVKNAEKDMNSLDENLAKFFCKEKKKDGKKYKASALQTLRNGLRRHYLEQLGVDIVNDKAFSCSSKVFKASVVDLRRQGLNWYDSTSPGYNESRHDLTIQW